MKYLIAAVMLISGVSTSFADSLSDAFPKRYDVNVNVNGSVYRPASSYTTPNVNFNPTPNANFIDAAMSGYERGQSIAIQRQQIEILRQQGAGGQATQNIQQHPIDSMVSILNSDYMPPSEMSQSDVMSTISALEKIFKQLNKKAKFREQNQQSFQEVLVGFGRNSNKLSETYELVTWVRNLRLSAYNMGKYKIVEEINEQLYPLIAHFRNLLIESDQAKEEL